MRKKIDFAPYEEAELKMIYEDGSALCNLFGGKVSDADQIDGDSMSESIREQWLHTDTDILFPADSPILSLSQADIEQFAEEQKTLMEQMEAQLL